jgi:hypothetical protein
MQLIPLPQGNLQESHDELYEKFLEEKNELESKYRRAVVHHSRGVSDWLRYMHTGCHQLVFCFDAKITS